MSAKTPGEIFKEARLKKGLTQVQVAEKSGVNANTYAKLERGEQKPSLATIKKIARVLDIDVPRLIDAVE